MYLFCCTIHLLHADYIAVIGHNLNLVLHTDEYHNFYIHKHFFFTCYNIFSMHCSYPPLGQVCLQSFKSSFIKGMKKQHQQPQKQRPAVASFQDFLIKLNMKQCMHLVEINIFSINTVTFRPTKIMKRADKKKNGKFLENKECI